MDENNATTTLPATTFEYNDGFDPQWTLDNSFATSPINKFIDDNVCHGFWRDAGTRPVDVNRHGYSDLIYGNASVGRGVILNDTNKSWVSPPNGWTTSWDFIRANSSDPSLRILDVNGDGAPDLVGSEDPARGVFINTGTTFATSSLYNIPTSFFQQTYFGDVNGDGLTDIIQSSSATSSVFINQGDGEGRFSTSGYSFPFQFMDLGTHVTDVNNDGLVDIIVSNSTSTTFKRAYINKGNGTGWEEDSRYSIAMTFADNGEDLGVRIADVTNDGYPDNIQAYTNSGTPQQRVHVNNGDGTGWSDYSTFPIPDHFAYIGSDIGFRFMDVTGDGIWTCAVNLLWRQLLERRVCK